MISHAVKKNKFCQIIYFVWKWNWNLAQDFWFLLQIRLLYGFVEDLSAYFLAPSGFFFIHVAVFQNVNNYFDKYNVIRTNRNDDQAYEKTIQHLIILNYPLRRLRLTTENLWRHSEGCGCLAKVSMKETSRNLIFPHSSLQEFICQRARGPSAAKCSYLPDGTTVIMSIIVQVSKVIPTPYVQLSHDAF